MRYFVALVLFEASALGAPSLSHQHHQHLHNVQKAMTHAAGHPAAVTQTNTLYRREPSAEAKPNGLVSFASYRVAS